MIRVHPVSKRVDRDDSFEDPGTMRPKTSLDELRIDRSHAGSRARLVGLAAIGLLLVASAVFAWWYRTREAVAEVRVAAVEEVNAGGATSAVLNASGYVTARRRATVSSKVTGKVLEVLVEEGMAVRKGQVLARLDPSTVQAYVALARSELAAAHRAGAEADVRLNEARTTLKRTQSLVADGILTQADLDRAQAEVEALQARLALNREQILVAERQVAVREHDLDDLTITAPFAGVAISKDAQPGEMVSPVSAGGGFTRTGICTIVDMSSLEIEVDVNESYINRVVPAQRVEAVLDAYQDWPIPAKVITTIPAADRQKATVLVRIAFDKLDPRILPDMGVKVAFLEATRPEAPAKPPELLVPRTAVRRDGSHDVVFVVNGDRVERRAVRIGPARGDRAVALSGLQAGERVVVDGAADLSDARRVKVK
jgi:RND family efflux transporter MFP subunit